METWTTIGLHLACGLLLSHLAWRLGQGRTTGFPLERNRAHTLAWSAAAVVPFLHAVRLLAGLGGQTPLATVFVWLSYAFAATSALCFILHLALFMRNPPPAWPPGGRRRVGFQLAALAVATGIVSWWRLTAVGTSVGAWLLVWFIVLVTITYIHQAAYLGDKWGRIRIMAAAWSIGFGPVGQVAMGHPYGDVTGYGLAPFAMVALCGAGFAWFGFLPHGALARWFGRWRPHPAPRPNAA